MSKGQNGQLPAAGPGKHPPPYAKKETPEGVSFIICKL